MRVAVAIIIDDQQRILITRRPLHAPHGGMWEFPGGKLEQDESATAALIREIKEEVALDIQDYDFLGEVQHTYTDRSVVLLVYCVRVFQGEAVAREKQMDLRWVAVNDLKDFEFPEANLEIMTLINRSTIDK